MKFVIVAVRDRAADVFAHPMFVPAVGVALRAFNDQVNKNEQGNQLFAHPEDFDMYELGSYDDSNGKFETHEPRQIAIGKDTKVLTNGQG